MDRVVPVAGGRVRGVWRGDLWAFSGIPYRAVAGRRTEVAASASPTAMDRRA